MKKTLTLLSVLISLQISLAQWADVASGLTDDICIQDIYAVDASTAWAATTGFFTIGGEMLAFTRTIDGETWTPGILDHPDAAGCTYSNICAQSGSEAWVALYNLSGGGGIYHTDDGGTSWEHQTTAEFAAPSGFPNVVHMFDTNNGFCMGDPNGGYFEIYTTTDGGDTWTRVAEENIPAPIDGEFGIVDNYTVFGETIWFGSNIGNIYKSDDMGYTWAKYATDLPYTGDIAFTDAEHGICVSTEDFRTTSDGGATWNEEDYDGDPRYFCLATIPGTSIIVSCERNDLTNFFNDGSAYTMDNGLTWIEIDDEIPMLALSFISTSTGWAGSCNGTDPETGIYKLDGDLLVAVQEFAHAENTLSVYPNPASTDLNINVSEKQSSVIQISDMFGNIVYDGKLNASDGKIKINHLANGLYLVRSDADGLMQTKTFLKQ